MVSSKKKVLSAFLSLAMIGTMVAAVPLTASADAATTTATPVVTYSVHQQTYGWESTVTGPATAGVTGQSKRLEALKINAPSGATITYSVHQQTYGWEAAVTNGATAGVTGKSKRLEAVKISLSGLPGYTIQYRVHQQTYGWENWVSNGATAGVTGQSKRLEAIQIKLVPTVATMSAVSSTIAAGGQTAFSFKDASGNAYTPKSVTYSVDSSFGSISNGVFTASSKAGTATVTAVADGVTLTAPVIVYGAAAGVALSAASSTVVANNASTDAITLTVVDAAGNPVKNFNGYADFGYSANNGAVAYYVNSTQQSTVQGVPIVNGVATVTVQSKLGANLTDTLEATGIYSSYSDAVTPTNAVSSSWSMGTVAITTAPQVATSISVSAASSLLGVNLGTETDNVYAEVEDQTGNPMLTGTYAVTFALTGPATFDGSSSVSTSGAGYGTGSTFVDAQATVHSKLGQTGTISVSATYGSITGAVAITAQPAQAAAKLALSFTDSSNPTDGVVGNYKVVLEDANGIAVAAASNVTVSLASSDTNSNVTIPASVTIPTGSSSATFAVNNTVAETITLTASNSSYTSGTVSATWVAGAATDLHFTPNVTTPKAVPTTSTSTSITAQLVDANGNAVKTAGVEVDFTVDASSTGIATHSITLNGTTVTPTNYTTTTVKVLTDANGIASLTAVPQGYAGDTWVVKAAVPAQSGISAITTPTQKGEVKVVNQVATSLASSVTDTTKSAATNYFNAGDTVTFSFTAKDANSNPVAGDQILVTPTSGSLTYSAGATDNGDGTYTTTTAATGIATITFIAKVAGTYTVASKDLTSGAAAGTISFITTASQTVDGYAVYDASGNLISSTTYSAGTPTTTYASTRVYVDASGSTPIALTVKPVDQYGNPIIATNALTVALTDSGTGASSQFRTSATGANITGTNKEVTIPAGQAALTVYYVNGNSSATSITVTAANALSVADNSSSSTALSAKVTDANSAVVGGVVVTFTKGATTYTATTDSTGVATVSGTFSGVYTISILGVNSTGVTSATATTTSI